MHPARPVCAAPTAAVATLSTPLHSTIPYLNLRNRAPASKVLPSSAPPPFSPPRPPTRMPPTRGQTQFAAQRSRTAPLAAWPATSNGVRPRQSRARAGGTRLSAAPHIARVHRGRRAGRAGQQPGQAITADVTCRTGRNGVKPPKRGIPEGRLQLSSRPTICAGHTMHTHISSRRATAGVRSAWVRAGGARARAGPQLSIAE